MRKQIFTNGISTSHQLIITLVERLVLKNVIGLNSPTEPKEIKYASHTPI